MTKASDNDFPSLLFTEQGSTPTTPAASHQRLFIRTSDHKLCYVNSSGTVTTVDTSGGGSEVAYAEITTAVTVSATSEGTAGTVVALGSTTYAAVPHLIEVYSPRADQNGGTLICDLYVDSTILGRIMVTSAAILPVYAKVRYTPSAGAHTFTWKAWRATANPVIDADVGGTGKSVAAWIRSSVA